MNLRYHAACIVHAVRLGESLTDCLESMLPNDMPHRDKAFVQACTFGVCRYYFSLEARLNALLSDPQKLKGSVIHSLLLVGLFQLIHMRVPSYAAVTETVNASRRFKKKWAPALSNFVLREWQRRADSFVLPDTEDVQYDHPSWWIHRLSQDWPNDYKAILAANMEHPPFTLRVNQRRISRDAYALVCAECGIETMQTAWSQDGLVLQSPISHEALPHFSDGYVSVQDESAQLAADVLQLEKGLKVLDACAAPGGKLCHFLEREPSIQATAVELQAKRFRTIEANLKRLQLNAHCHLGDIRELALTLQAETFDRVLLDAPCTGSGVVRRHPDMKLLRQAGDVQAMANLQYELLSAVWPLLKLHGRLVYATCSLFRLENEEVIERFLKTHPRAKHAIIDVPFGVSAKLGRYLLPSRLGGDGFYYACLTKEE